MPRIQPVAAPPTQTVPSASAVISMVPARLTRAPGNYDYLLQVEVADLPAYEDFHANRLASLPGVAMVNSYVTMKTLSGDTT